MLPPGTASPLGVGILYNPALAEFLHANLKAVDYVSVIPDTFWTDQGMGTRGRYREISRYVEFLDWLACYRPLVVHGLGMSIGSAQLFDREHLEQLSAWFERYRFRWHSEHLSYARIPVEGGGEHNAGLALPVPYDAEVLEMIGARVALVREAIQAPFLLENNVYYAEIPHQEMSETEFLNRLCRSGSCGLLLDLHNVHTNAVNHGIDARAFIDALDLAAVLEIHIAGGNEIGGVYTDSHAGPCPREVWELLEYIAARTPNLLGITFEFHESYNDLLNEDGIQAQLGKAREIWETRPSLCLS